MGIGTVLERVALVAIAVLAMAVTASADELRGVALVVGQSKYVRLPKLPNPEGDARAIDHLLDDFGFDVTRVLDARADELEGDIAEFTQAAANADVAIVYYAGHGVEVGGKNYILATDADISSPEKAAASLIPLDSLLEKLQGKVPVTIVLLDACRTSPFADGETVQLPGMDAPAVIGTTGLAVVVRGPTPVDAPEGDETMGAVVGFSASPGQAALDGEPGQNSPYAAAILKHLVASGYSFGDVMTMVSQEVYVQTHARQLPWTNSSLNRVLYFGRDADAAEGDEAAILGERRKLLLSIAAAPIESKSYVEAVATESQLDLAELYSMLDVIGGGTGDLGAADPAQLSDIARRLRDVLDDPLLPTAPTDPELARLDALANAALTAGAVELAYDYRKQQANHAAKLEKALDKKAKQLEADRLELAGVYARIAETAMLNLDLQGEADQYKRAAKQVSAFDKGLSLKLRLRAAKAFAEKAFRDHDDDAFEAAIALFQDLLEEVDKEKSPDLWGDIQYRLADLLLETSYRQNDIGRRQDGLRIGLTLIRFYDKDSQPERWVDAQFLVERAQYTLNDLAGARRTLNAILKQVTKDRAPLSWARAQSDLGQVMGEQGWWHPSDSPANSLSDGIKAYQAAQTVFTRDRFPGEWARQQGSVGENTIRFGLLGRDETSIREGMRLLRSSLDAASPNQEGLWAHLNDLIGKNFLAAGTYLNDAAVMREALAGTDAALAYFTRKSDPRRWSDIQQFRGDALIFLGKAESDRELLLAAREAFAGALEVFEDYDEPSGIGRLKTRIDQVDRLLGQ